MLSVALFTVAALFAQPAVSKLFGNDAEWDGLRVTFGMNPFDSNTFAALPRTTNEATSSGWTADPSVTCETGGAFRGNRYIHKNGDTATMLLFDKSGYIAGIQAGIPKNIATGYPAPNLFKAFIEEANQWTITVYFVDTSIICSSGRTADQFMKEGTGTGVTIQIGADADKDQMIIPMKEGEVAGTQWTKGKCFYMMGMHYWYNLRVDMPLDEFFPVFLLYNKGVLNGFGWAFNADITSTRYEHPPKSSFAGFMEVPPTDLLNLPYDVSTLHIYMTSDPRKNFC